MIDFDTRYSNADPEQIAQDMIELAAHVSEEAFHYVCGAVYMLGLTRADRRTRVALLRQLYEYRLEAEQSDDTPAAAQGVES